MDQLRDAGFDVADDDVTRLGPTMSEHINVNGRYYFDLAHTPHSSAPGVAATYGPRDMN